jgi:hypothetical protein
MGLFATHIEDVRLVESKGVRLRIQVGRRFDVGGERRDSNPQRTPHRVGAVRRRRA